MTPSAATAAKDARTSFDVERVRRDFPILAERIHGKPLVYLDSANTSQKPQVGARRDGRLLSPREREHPPRHPFAERTRHRALRRGEGQGRHVHQCAGSADHRVDQGHDRRNQPRGPELRRAVLRAGRRSLISWLEHHSNIVPWQLVCEQTGRGLRVAPINDAGEVDLEAFVALLSPRTRIVAIGACVECAGYGQSSPARSSSGSRARRGRAGGRRQAVPHFAGRCSVARLRFLRFSGHKMFGPTGIGVLYGRLAARGDAAVSRRRRHDPSVT